MFDWWAIIMVAIVWWGSGYVIGRNAENRAWVKHIKSVSIDKETKND